METDTANNDTDGVQGNKCMHYDHCMLLVKIYLFKKMPKWFLGFHPKLKGNKNKKQTMKKASVMKEKQ